MSNNIYASDKLNKKGHDDFFNFVNSLKIVPHQVYSGEKNKEGKPSI